MSKQHNDRCSFCGRSVKEVPLLPGLYGNICNDCVKIASQIIQENEKKSQENAAEKPLPPTPSPKKIKEVLDQYVVGNDETKKVLAVAVHNHYRRLQAALEAKKELPATKSKSSKKAINSELDEVEIEKSNVLLLGPTGTGKTLLARTLAKVIGVPFAIGDATTLTQAGYVGEDVENLVRYLLQNADGDIELAKRGIIYVDEIDKIASRTSNVSITRDVSGEGVQQALLKIIEGTICRVPPKGGRKHPDQEYIEVDTSNILFICGGAFVGLDKIVAERQDKKTIGFGNADEEGSGQEIDYTDIRPEDLIKFGLIPEFTGRLPIITAMKELTEDDLVRILKEPKNSLVKQYKKLLSLDGVDLEFEDDALRELASMALKRKTGARGLRAEMERLMNDFMYEAPGNPKMKKLVVTAEMIKKRLGK